MVSRRERLEVTAANSTATKNPFKAIRTAMTTKSQNNEFLL